MTAARPLPAAPIATVVNRNLEQFDVYIGRGSIWGSPFVIGKDGSREQCIAKYREWIRRQPTLLTQLDKLRGKRLGCYCAPYHCHGDVLVELLEERYGAPAAPAAPAYDPRAHGAMCDVCPLGPGKRTHWRPVGPAPAPSGKTLLVVVGEGPGRNEELKGEPFCLVPSTLVLMADLTWKPLGDVRVGDRIIGVDEEPPTGPGISARVARQWKIGEVTGVHTSVQPTHLVQTALGQLEGTGDHRVLTSYRKGAGTTRYGRRWQRIDDLVCGTQRRSRLTHIGVQPWVAQRSYAAGWMAGFLDGEGHILGSRSARVKRAGYVGFSQNAGPTFELAVEMAARLGLPLRVADKGARYKSGHTCRRVTFKGTLPEMMQLLGRIRPERLIANFQHILERETKRPSTRNLTATPIHSRVSTGPQQVVDITTTIGTFIANGFVVHNCGPSGKLLDQCLNKAGFQRRDAYVTNATCCRPETEQQVEIARIACAPRLFNELRALGPKVPILSLGGVPTKVLLGTNSIIKARGFVWHVPALTNTQRKAAELALTKLKKRENLDAFSRLKKMSVPALKLWREDLAGRTVLPTLHPAFILRSEIWAPLLRLDIKRAAQVAGLMAKGMKPKLEDQRPYLVVSNPVELRKALAPLAKEATVDIETDGADPLRCKIVCVGIGDERRRVIAYPWVPAMAPVLSEAFRQRTWVGHNIITFDAIVLRRHGVRMTTKIEDTLVASHTFASHLPKSLLHVASVYTDASPWKHAARGEGKTEKGLPHKLAPEELTRYNAGDIGLTALAWRRMQADLEPERPVYEQMLRVSQLCAEMRVTGIGFDIQRARELTATLRARRAVLLGRMRKLTGIENFSPSRGSDIRRALYGDMGVPILAITKTGLPMTGRTVLERLRGGDDAPSKLADLILRWRDAAKTASTYLAVDLGPDKRVHGDWRIGPVTGRLACRLMTLPRYTKDRHTGKVDPTDMVRECYVAREGHVFVYFDLKQAEARMAAYASNDPRFIEAVQRDVHLANARILFPADLDGLSDEEVKKGAGQQCRDIAKNYGFAVTYLAGWETIYAYLAARGFTIKPGVVMGSMDRLHAAYKVYFAWVQSNVDFVKKHGYMRTLISKRIRWFGRYPKPSEVASHPIQSGIADLMNDRLWRINRNVHASAKLVMQVHDAGIFETPEDKIDHVKRTIQRVWDEPVRLEGRPEFVMPIDLKVGRRLSEL